MTARWHVLRHDDGLTLCRHLPPRFDIEAGTTLPDVRPLPLAHQMRQDIWRALQNQRGFSPVIELTRDETMWRVRAGGRHLAPVTTAIRQRLQDVLDDADNRARWIRFARR